MCVIFVTTVFKFFNLAIILFFFFALQLVHPSNITLVIYTSLLVYHTLV